MEEENISAASKSPVFDDYDDLLVQSTASSESQSSEKGHHEQDEVKSGHNSEHDSIGKVFLDEQGSCAPPVDDQSLMLESRPNDRIFHGEEILSEIVQKEKIKFNNLYFQLQRAIENIASLKRDINKESCERLKAESEALRASRNAIASEKLYVKEKKQRIKGEEVMLDLVLKLETIRNERDTLFEKLLDIQNQKESLENEISGIQEKLGESESLINCLQSERDNALRNAQKLEPISITTDKPNILKFTYLEVEHATLGFDDSMKIGGRPGRSVYKGFLRYTELAIKTDLECTLTHKKFLEEVNALSRLRHPNMLNLVGICPDSRSLVYEFLPNGSLEKYLDGTGNCRSLDWKVRICAATEICSTLIFLHSCRPDGIVHGNLKPSNILFDAHFNIKLCDLCTHQVLDSADAQDMEYRDPEFLSTGKLTTKSDIYSFGVIVLQLLTGRPVFGIIDEVSNAMEKENLQDILDKSAGQWPFVQAQQLLHMSLRCCQPCSHDRPDLVVDAWRVLDPMRRASSPGPFFPLAKLPVNDVPSYFICPILQEIMTDPHVAADGFTYEFEAVKAWYEGGHNTSPMTNMELLNQDLIPNHSLRSVIQEWSQQKG